jgi:hypothetical protein
MAGLTEAHQVLERIGAAVAFGHMVIDVSGRGPALATLPPITHEGGGADPFPRRAIASSLTRP